ncbi:MAG TPA: ATP-binding protein [Anaerolineales bacterium]|nr:ATP-binding protein [Anaerolineales bacterium]HNC89721.1 ATP-binding protein [Anaerolineales bacterium]HND92397.1 ATP-binding protein [Anaerolineales bacterium]HNF36320.1 ATP-binding protein [Anaerolineales bacterium]
MAGSRKLQYADRVALQQADQAIRKDVLRALVEIITNSNDSYSRLEHAGLKVSGEIIIDIQRKHKNSIIRVTDRAEGMTDTRMDKVVGTYGEATSGLKEDKNVRGMWGRGLKDSIFGLGYGYVHSFKGAYFYSCALLLKNGIPTFELQPPVRATVPLREKYGIPEGNGTILEIIVSRDDVKVPQFDNFRNYLQRHFELRPIMSNPKRKIILRDVPSAEKIRHEHILSYKSPRGEKVLSEKIKIEGYPAAAKLEVFRSAIQLSTRGEEGDYADGGLLVISRATVISLTMLKFENDPYAGYFYGSIQCDHLHDLLKNDEPVLTATRDGINWSHPFAKALKLAVENKLEPLIEAERKHAVQDEQTHLDKQFRQKIDHALHELNTIALNELSDRRDDGDQKRIDLPPSGIGFFPERVHVQTGQTISLTLFVKLSEKVRPGATVTVISNSPEVIVLNQQAVLQPHKTDDSVGRAHIRVEGRQVGGEGLVTAYIGKQRAQALVQVRSKKETLTIAPSRSSNALFTDIHFDDRTDPRQRVYFDRVNSSIVIATAAPSVKLYLDKQNRLDTTVQGQVLLAELITEAVCREIARSGVERGRFLAPDGAEADAINNHFIRLQNQYSHLIHKYIVTLE